MVSRVFDFTSTWGTYSGYTFKSFEGSFYDAYGVNIGNPMSTSVITTVEPVVPSFLSSSPPPSFTISWTLSGGIIDNIDGKAIVLTKIGVGSSSDMARFSVVNMSMNAQRSPYGNAYGVDFTAFKQKYIRLYDKSTNTTDNIFFVVNTGVTGSITTLYVEGYFYDNYGTIKPNIIASDKSYYAPIVGTVTTIEAGTPKFISSAPATPPAPSAPAPSAPAPSTPPEPAAPPPERSLTEFSAITTMPKEGYYADTAASTLGLYIFTPDNRLTFFFMTASNGTGFANSGLTSYAHFQLDTDTGLLNLLVKYPSTIRLPFDIDKPTSDYMLRFDGQDFKYINKYYDTLDSKPISFVEDRSYLVGVSGSAVVTSGYYVGRGNVLSTNQSSTLIESSSSVTSTNECNSKCITNSACDRWKYTSKPQACELYSDYNVEVFIPRPNVAVYNELTQSVRGIKNNASLRSPLALMQPTDQPSKIATVSGCLTACGDKAACAAWDFTNVGTAFAKPCKLYYSSALNESAVPYNMGFVKTRPSLVGTRFGYDISAPYYVTFTPSWKGVQFLLGSLVGRLPTFFIYTPIDEKEFFMDTVNLVSGYEADSEWFIQNSGIDFTKPGIVNINRTDLPLSNITFKKKDNTDLVILYTWDV